ncbi:hypothetical protein HNY73_018761 [Argiope bruennichi]|uniref:Uncharacterized protein n=1 Tax=Argiope bruennichi TaxID=94029 RepID=A0A8T0EI24_ARGBR|nr:hypothetical protein HNY73_018761 [Argiope bruennichi]
MSDVLHRILQHRAVLLTVVAVFLLTEQAGTFVINDKPYESSIYHGYCLSKHCKEGLLLSSLPVFESWRELPVR